MQKTRGRPKGSRLGEVKRIIISFTLPLFERIIEVAKIEHLSIKDALIRLVRLGLFLHKHQKAGNEIIIQTGTERTKILIS